MLGYVIKHRRRCSLNLLPTMTWQWQGCPEMADLIRLRHLKLRLDFSVTLMQKPVVQTSARAYMTQLTTEETTYNFESLLNVSVLCVRDVQ